MLCYTQKNFDEKESGRKKKKKKQYLLERWTAFGEISVCFVSINVKLGFGGGGGRGDIPGRAGTVSMHYDADPPPSTWDDPDVKKKRRLGCRKTQMRKSESGILKI